MAKATYVFIISLFIFASAGVAAQDTIMVPLHLRVGVDIARPAGYFINKDLKSFGLQGSFEFSERLAVTGGTIFSHYSVNKETYDYKSQGMTFTLGPDFNLMKPKLSEGKNFIGFGIHYGISFYSHETPRMEYTNAWGTETTSIPSSSHVGHFIEVTPGVRTEVFPGVTMGWNLSLRMLLSDGTKSNLKPVNMPGFGDCSSRVSSGISYFISITIPYHTKRIIIKPREEEEEEEEPAKNEETESGFSSGNTSF
ncbi:MAG TPA: DUF6048 family protein [Bacteroidales bacterium]|nr:DUF6048 family protein [Bacteroidales bacterium]HPT11186.1 DUF6048 family protein [Bacteroidales bacterium]